MITHYSVQYMIDIKFPQRDAFGTSINRQIANNIKIKMTKIPNKEQFIFRKVLNFEFKIWDLFVNCLPAEARLPKYLCGGKTSAQAGVLRFSALKKK